MDQVKGEQERRELPAAAAVTSSKSGLEEGGPPVVDQEVAVPRPDAADLLRAAAAGRRETAEGMNPGNPRQASYREEFLAEAVTLEMAARVVEGDLGPLYNWLPSWRWSEEMNARIDESFRTATRPSG